MGFSREARLRFFVEMKMPGIEKEAHHSIQCQICCSPQSWVEQPEDEGTEEAEAGEEKVDCEVYRRMRLGEESVRE